MTGSSELEAARAAVNGTAAATAAAAPGAAPATIAAAGAAAGEAAPSAPAPLAPSPADVPFVPMPDTPAALAAVQDARADAEASRRAFGGEVEQLKASARRTFDVRAQLASVPDRIRSDPRRAAMAGGVVAAGVLGIAGLRRLRRAKPPTLLPPEVEAAIGSLGPDAEAVRAALNRSFTKYLEEHGARGPMARIPRGAFVLLVPVVSAVGREVTRRYLSRLTTDEER